MQDQNPDSAPDAISRRRAVRKAAVGVGAAGVAWSAPRVTGLSLRPDFAAAQSAVTTTTLPPGVDVTLSLTVDNLPSGADQGAPTPTGSGGGGRVSFSESTTRTDALPAGLNSMNVGLGYHDEAFYASQFSIFGGLARDAAATCTITNLDATNLNTVSKSSPSSGSTYSSIYKAGPTMTPGRATVTMKVSCT